MRIILALLSCTMAASWTMPSQPSSLTRQDFVKGTTALVASGIFGLVVTPPALAVETMTKQGVSIEVKQTGTGPKPNSGELAAIRFAAYAGDTKIDDIFNTPEPYYTRIGSGGLLKGVELVLPDMRVGDRWVLTIPVRIA
jgi:hypothetical protein